MRLRGVEAEGTKKEWGGETAAQGQSQRWAMTRERLRGVEAEGDHMRLGQVGVPRARVRDKVLQAHAPRLATAISHRAALQHTAALVAVALQPALVGEIARARLDMQDVLEALAVIVSSAGAHLPHDGGGALEQPLRHNLRRHAHIVLDPKCRLCRPAKHELARRGGEAVLSGGWRDDAYRLKATVE